MKNKQIWVFVGPNDKIFDFASSYEEAKSKSYEYHMSGTSFDLFPIDREEIERSFKISDRPIFGWSENDFDQAFSA